MLSQSWLNGVRNWFSQARLTRTSLRRNRRKHGRSLTAAAEQFEVRSLLSNTVVASLSGDFLNLSGDSRSNGVEIHVDAGGIHATGSVDMDTQIKFDGHTYAPGEEVLLTSDTTLSYFNASLGRGNDNLLVRVDEGTLTDNGSMVIDGGSGNDTVTLSTAAGAYLDIGGALIIYGGSGNDQIVAATDEAMNNFSAADPSTIVDGSNDIQVGLSILIYGQGGNDIIALGGASTGGNLLLDSANGNDHVGLSDVEVTYTTFVYTGSGNDCFVASNLHSEAGLYVSDYSGNDQVGLSQSSIGGVLSVYLGSGNDDLALDTVNVDGSLVFLYGGTGHDSLQSNVDLSDAHIYSFEDQNATVDFTGCLEVFAGLNPNPNIAPTAVNDIATTAPNTAVVVAVLANDTDPNGDPLTPSIVSQGTKGTAVVNPDHTVTYTPNLNATGVDTFTYHDSDGKAFSNTATVTITIAVTNRAPVAANGTLTTAEDTTATGTLVATDVDGNALTYSLVDVSAAHGVVTITNAATGAYSYVPALDYNGPASFTFKANDGTVDSNIATVSITVTPVNDAPIASNGTLTTAEDTPATGTLVATDVDSAVLTYSLVDVSAAHGVVTITDAATGAYSYVPDLNYNGPASFTFKANDGFLDSNIATVSITVTPVNDAPVASDGTLTTLEDTTATGTLVATDVDGDALVYSVVDATAAHGVVTITNAATGAYSYVPDLNYNGPASFTFKANDGTVDSNIATVSITVTPVNDAPIASNGTLTTAEDTPATGTLVATDVDSAVLTYSLVDVSAAHGVVTITDAATGAYSYVPDLNYNGPASFTFKANDGFLDSNIATVSITVTPVNDAPVAVNDSAATNEDTVLVVAAPGVLINDFDPDTGETATLTVVAYDATSTLGATVVVNPNGGYTYDPTSSATLNALPVGATATDTFTYTISDIHGATSTATVTITVAGLNDAPVAVKDTGATNEDTVLVVVAPGVLSNDSDPDTGETATLTVTGYSATSAKGATVVVNPDGSYSYDPTSSATLNALAVGTTTTDTFTYTISDIHGAMSTATVTITVTGVNDAPVAVNDQYSTLNNAIRSVPARGVLTNDVDPDAGETATLVVSAFDATSALGATVVVNPDGSFTYDPRTSAALTALPRGSSINDTFTYTIRDVNGATSTATVTMTVLGA